MGSRLYLINTEARFMKPTLNQRQAFVDPGLGSKERKLSALGDNKSHRLSTFK